MPTNLPGFNLISPFGRVVRYVPVTDKGFFIRPADNANPDGWGEPFTDPEGNPIVPGTPGGPNPVKFIANLPDRGWQLSRRPGAQLYGNIDWKGPPKVTGSPLRGHWRLTYHGPPGRYFRASTFVYGAEDAHHDIYSEGRCIAVAPHPVLGAALQTDGSGQRWLVVITKNGSEDYVYTRPYNGGGVYRGSYTEAFRTAAMALQSDSNPDGWRRIGRHAPTVSATQGGVATILEPATPWFFNESGTEAQTMRECDVEFDRGDINVTQRGYHRFRCTITPETADFLDVGNEPGFTLRVDTDKRAQPDLVVETRWPALFSPPDVHHWKVDSIFQELLMSGRYVLGVDYRGNDEVLIEAVYLGRRTHEQWFYTGIDTTYEPAHPEPNDGDREGDWFNSPTHNGLPPFPGDGRQSFWLFGGEDLQLRVGDVTLFNFFKTLTGSRSRWETGERDPEDVALYYQWFGRRYPHFLDAREPQWVAEFDVELVQTPAGTTGEFFQVETEEYSRDGGTVGQTFMYRNLPTTNLVMNLQVGVGYGWTHATNDAWADNFTTVYEFVIKDGVIPGPGHPQPLQFPATEADPMAVYNEPAINFGYRRPLVELVSDAVKSYREGGMASDDFGNTILSMQYPNHEFVTSYYSNLNGDVERLNLLAEGGDWFYPLGVS